MDAGTYVASLLKEQPLAEAAGDTVRVAEIQAELSRCAKESQVAVAGGLENTAARQAAGVHVPFPAEDGNPVPDRGAPGANKLIEDGKVAITAPPEVKSADAVSPGTIDSAQDAADAVGAPASAEVAPEAVVPPADVSGTEGTPSAPA